MKRHLFLIFWILGILFPMAWFMRTSPLAYRLFNTLFSPAWMHIVMHTLLFAVLGAFLMHSTFGRLPRALGIGFVLALVLSVALLQESIQLYSGQRAPHADNLFDIGVDMLGGLLGVLLALGFRKIAVKWARQPSFLTR